MSANANAQEKPSLLPLVALAAIALWVLAGRDGAVPPAPPAGPDLVSVFRTNDDRSQARQHARTFATICGSVAEYLEYDGTRAEPLITTGVQIDDFRRSLRQTRMKGWSFLAQYQHLAPALEQFLTAEVGPEGGPFTAEQRAKWVAAMRQLEASALYASNQG